MTFYELNLIEPLLRSIEKKGFTTPTPIQNLSVPHILKGEDIFGCAQTGTGKTAAFGLPILQHLSASNPHHPNIRIRALVLAPTRELAMQIHECFCEYGQFTKLRINCVFGGVSQLPQVAKLRKGTDILIATPGRLMDLMQQGFVRLDNVTHFVLDEADRMLDMGFISDIRKIAAKLPRERQTLLFSATAPDEIRKLSESLLRKPVHISIEHDKTDKILVKESVYMVKKEDKRGLLKQILSDRAVDQALVFTRTRRGADRVARELSKNGISAEAIHGDKSQNARDRALNGFRSKKLFVLVATDVASRGIDITKLSHVVNFEIPEQAETYVHRIGRTGRAGESGNAISLCTTDEMPYLKSIQKLTGNKIRIMQHSF